MVVISNDINDTNVIDNRNSNNNIANNNDSDSTKDMQ